ncbi:PhnD/SsuA/transferrin family substrate-binding protein [Pseudanabaena sp. FACHB-2040]|uniref:phosphate/phosphite/phosphonate ABC transporter substrate-binding protein n=1 Tax=Pseudanabaena sp. FACHB-2040 TaxID=2692859 RepID=UPI001685581D|nr:PhnD/SsuA/transferrin family substrate-binding protein [Pseudanabaena sp. FACHB-2040]MBD2259099.1 PhnD/SsuA/transferrin family substrate-binding protein [Pseudanabaena sp. FACHB-2040]
MARLRRLFAIALLGLLVAWVLALAGCGESPSAAPPTRLTVGLVSYDADSGLVEKYERFQAYLAERLKATVELDPAFNELRAVEQIQAGTWSLVFAPAGLAAIALAEAQYVPIFPLQGTPNLKSVLVVREDSPAQSRTDLTNQTLALGQPGSATGYYLPLYDLYGLTLKEVRFAPTPKTILAWLQDGSVAAGAMSEDDFQAHRREFADTSFRILHQSRAIPMGAVLLSPLVDRNQQRLIEAAMKEAPSNISADAGYVSTAAIPDFDQLIQLVEKVRPLEANIRQQPAILTLEPEEAS